MSQQDLHGCSETIKNYTEHSLVWICSVHNEIMKHCGILLQDTCMRVGAWEPVPPAYRWPPSPQAQGPCCPRRKDRIRLGGSFSTVVVVVRDIIVQNSVTAVCREENIQCFTCPAGFLRYKTETIIEGAHVVHFTTTIIGGNN